MGFPLLEATHRAASTANPRNLKTSKTSIARVARLPKHAETR